MEIGFPTETLLMKIDNVLELEVDLYPVTLKIYLPFLSPLVILIINGVSF